MTGFVAAAAVVAWLALLCFLGWGSLEFDRAWPWLIGICAWLVVTFGLVFNAAAEEDAKGPCLREETSYQWNPATKTVMPYTYCADRGTWSK